MHLIDESRASFVSGSLNTDFPLQNLPYGVFSTSSTGRRIGVAIGDFVLDIAALQATEFAVEAPAHLFAQTTLNALAGEGRGTWTRIRRQLADLLEQGSSFSGSAAANICLVPRASITLHLPFDIGGFTDFYCSEHHASRCSRIIRGSAGGLPPQWQHLPIAYNGRASSVVVSGTPLRRPHGQSLTRDGSSVRWGPTQALDFELELGAFVGPGSALGKPVPLALAGEQIFGYVLLNDWSARDIQRFESAPLGPFQGKAFGTSISAWVVTPDALNYFRSPVEQPAVASYLTFDHGGSATNFDISLSVSLQPKGGTRSIVAKTSPTFMSWSFEQLIAHHTIGGCNLRTGDLIGSGTLSGPKPEQRACLLEMTFDGTQPLLLADGVHRAYLEDFDSVTFTGAGTTKSGQRIGFGSLEGLVLPSFQTEHQ
ncbi:fumarylacetoacetase [Variovorax sp. KK3]|uniref:fumarylacetoacetase n=1 Tax=Variovorax sp. KK3 TaxID=1855728 RepID=UPI00097C79DB|nr:fumarylacetoacetase [Variovorax sp. KK3]